MSSKFYLRNDESNNMETQTNIETTNSQDWPVSQDRQPIDWFPARYRLIGLVRMHEDGFVLPPAIIRKATWRE